MESPIWLMAIAVLAGVAVALQGAANSALAERISLPNALIVNTVVVLLGTIVYYVVSGLTPIATRRGLFESGGITRSGTPWICYIGGLCGFAVIAIVAYAFPRLGAAWTIGLLVLGQGLAAVTMDHFGLFSIVAQSITPIRIVGVALLVAGAYLVRQA